MYVIETPTMEPRNTLSVVIVLLHFWNRIHHSKGWYTCTYIYVLVGLYDMLDFNNRAYMLETVPVFQS